LYTHGCCGHIVPDNASGRPVIVMYRCYVIRNGRIASGEDLDVESLATAVAHGRRLLAARMRTGMFSGMEIWSGTSLIYSDKGYTEDPKSSAAIDSPFQTPESTMLPNWRTTLGRPIHAIQPAAIQDTPPAVADIVSVIESKAAQTALQEDADGPRFAVLRRIIRRKPVRNPIAA
jgi:hypothetical protein